MAEFEAAPGATAAIERRFEMAPVELDDETLVAQDAQPLTRRTELPERFRTLTLDEAIALALQDAKVLRSLGGTIVQNAAAANSVFNPAIQATDPNFGVEAALSAFDAQFTSSFLYQNNDDIFNNVSTTGSALLVQQDLSTFQYGLSKIGVTGTQYSLGSNIVHDNTDNRAVTLPSSWTYDWQASVRHPLLQGSGIRFNRIAGPSSQPGFLGTSGYLVSRTNQDISIAQFEQNVRQMVLEVINSYWQLSLAYKNFESLKGARDGAKQTLDIAQARMKNDLPGGEADSEAEARDQFLEFELRLLEARNGASSNGTPGVLQAEANLRRLIGLPQSDGEMLYPTDEAVEGASVFNWRDLSEIAVQTREEIRQQKLRVEQASLLLEAARNFTLPRLDAIATYRANGFGDDLVANSGRFSGAVNEAYSGDFDEWEFGFTLDVPIGYRRASAGVRNAELGVRREKAALKELQQQILHDLGTSLRALEQAESAVSIGKQRRDAARETVKARMARFDADAIRFPELLNAQRRLLDAELNYEQAKTNYELARETLLSESGKLLNEYSIFLTERNGNL